MDNNGRPVLTIPGRDGRYSAIMVGLLNRLTIIINELMIP